MPERNSFVPPERDDDAAAHLSVGLEIGREKVGEKPVDADREGDISIRGHRTMVMTK